MAKMGFEKRLENLERLANVRKADRLQVYFCDGSMEEMDVLSLLCKVAWDSAHPVDRYVVVGEVKSRMLLQVVDQLME